MTAWQGGCVAAALGLALVLTTLTGGWPLFANLAAPRLGLNAAYFSRVCVGLDAHRRHAALWWSSPGQFGNPGTWGPYRPVPIAVTHFACSRVPFIPDPLPQSGFWVMR